MIDDGNQAQRDMACVISVMAYPHGIIRSARTGNARGSVLREVLNGIYAA